MTFHFFTPRAAIGMKACAGILFGAMILFSAGSANAHHCKGGHANDPECDAPPPPPPPDPDVCTDEFPSFVYTKSVRNSPDELRVSSSEGCRTEFLANVDASRGPAFSYNNNRGLIAWTEDSENYDITILRFSVDPTDGALTVDTPPQTVLPTLRPSDIEYFFDIDSWADYGGDTDVELLAFHRFTVGDQNSSIEILDLATCSPTCSPDEIFALNNAGQQSCIAGTEGFSDPEEHPACFKPYGVSFNPTGNALFTTAEANQWQAYLRTGIVKSNLGWEAMSTDVVVVHDVYDCQAGALPIGRGDAIGLVGGKEILAASACVGFQPKGRGLRDQRLYFLDVELCMTTAPRDWQACQASAELRSGDYNGIGPSWLPNNELLYGGFTSKTLDSLRVFDPDLMKPVANDREVIEKAETGDTGL